jgi:hypothetical protein
MAYMTFNINGFCLRNFDYSSTWLELEEGRGRRTLNGRDKITENYSTLLISL